MAAPKIDSFQFGRIAIDGQHYTKDLIIFPDRVLSNWWREQGHSLSIVDLQAVLATPPQVLIIGTGVHGQMKVPTQTIAHLSQNNIQIISLKSEAACQHYNEIRSTHQVVLAIHLAC